MSNPYIELHLPFLFCPENIRYNPLVVGVLRFKLGGEDRIGE